MNRPLLIGSVVLLFGVLPDGHARITKAWSYQEMFDKSDLVVIGQVVTTTDTDERTKLLSLNVIGVVTEVKTYLVLKGNQSVKTLRLHHYRLASPRDEETVVNGPNLIRFSREHVPCLLFLVKEPDGGRYAPVTGQEDPGIHSVLELEGVAD